VGWGPRRGPRRGSTLLFRFFFFVGVQLTRAHLYISRVAVALLAHRGV